MPPLTHHHAVRALALALAWLWAAPAEAEELDGERELAASVRAGMEYDSNALRVEEDPTADVLARYFATLDLGLRPSPGRVVALGVRQGGKIFAEANGADTLLGQLVLSLHQRLGEGGSLRLGLDLKDRTERLSLRDYTAGGATLALGWAVSESLRLQAQGGWRYFAFKPDPDASSHGPVAGLEARLALGETVLASLGYTYSRRLFDTRRFEATDRLGTLRPDAVELREDDFHGLSMGLVWRGPLIVEGTYRFGLNASNSYGQRLVRHGVELTLTAPLVLGAFVSAHGELQRTNYEDPIVIDANFNIDEDNRNSLIVSLARPLFERWEVEARYSLYTQEFGAADGGGRDEDYLRQTFLLATAYLFD